MLTRRCTPSGRLVAPITAAATPPPMPVIAVPVGLLSLSGVGCELSTKPGLNRSVVEASFSEPPLVGKPKRASASTSLRDCRLRQQKRKPSRPRIAAAASPPTAMPAMAPVESSIALPLPAVFVPLALSAPAPAAVFEKDDSKLLGVEVGVIVVNAVTTTTLLEVVLVRPGGAGGLGGDGREVVDVDEDVEVDVDVDVDVLVEVELVVGSSVLSESEYSVWTGTVTTSSSVTVTKLRSTVSVLLWDGASLSA